MWQRVSKPRSSHEVLSSADGDVTCGCSDVSVVIRDKQMSLIATKNPFARIADGTWFVDQGSQSRATPSRGGDGHKLLGGQPRREERHVPVALILARHVSTSIPLPSTYVQGSYLSS
jgi:hypothetical protein